MGLFGPVGGLTLGTIAFLWATIRTTLYWIQTDSDGVAAVLDRLWDGYRLFVVTVATIVLAPGIARWLTDVWNLIGNLMP